MIPINECKTVQETNTELPTYPILGKINGMGLIKNCAYYAHYLDSADAANNPGVTACIACEKGYRGKMRF